MKSRTADTEEARLESGSFDPLLLSRHRLHLTAVSLQVSSWVETGDPRSAAALRRVKWKCQAGSRNATRLSFFLGGGVEEKTKQNKQNQKKTNPSIKWPWQ